MQIHQLNVQYQPEPDRILARINTADQQEFRLWLTRRLCLGWLPALRKLNEAAVQRSLGHDDAGMAARDPQVREMLGEFRRQRQLEEADFKTPYAEPASGQPAHELLVSELSMTPQIQGPTLLRFAARRPAGGPGPELQLHMEMHMLAGFLHLLETAFQSAQWGAASETTSAATASAQSARRPPYLN